MELRSTGPQLSGPSALDSSCFFCVAGEFLLEAVLIHLRLSQPPLPRCASNCFPARASATMADFLKNMLGGSKPVDTPVAAKADSGTWPFVRHGATANASLPPTSDWFHTLAARGWERLVTATCADRSNCRFRRFRRSASTHASAFRDCYRQPGRWRTCSDRASLHEMV